MITWPAGAGMPESQVDLPRANYAQELVVRADQAPGDPAFYRIRRPIPAANHLGVRYPAGMTGAVIRVAPDDGHPGDGHPLVIRCRSECRGDPAPPRQAAATDPFGAFRDGQLPRHERRAARSDQGSASLQAAAWAARLGWRDRGSVE